jgi:hypothetical protein
LKLDFSDQVFHTEIFSALDASADTIFDTLLMFRAHSYATRPESICPIPAPAFENERDFLLEPSPNLFIGIVFGGVCLVLDFSTRGATLKPAAKPRYFKPFSAILTNH